MGLGKKCCSIFNSIHEMGSWKILYVPKSDLSPWVLTSLLKFKRAGTQEKTSERALVSCL